MGDFSIWHWLIVLVIVMLIFGTKKLRNIGSDLGAAVREFKEGMRSGERADAPAQGEQAALADNGAAPEARDPKQGAAESGG